MDAEILKTVGQIAGIGGIALGVLLILFKEIVRKSIFPTLTKDQAYRLLRLIVVLTWSGAVAGIGAWVWGERATATADGSETHGDQSPIVTGTEGDVTISIGDDDSPEADP